MVVFSIGINLSEEEFLEFVSRVVELEDFNYTDSCLGFTEFLAVIAFIITVSFTLIYIDVYKTNIIKFSIKLKVFKFSIKLNNWV